MEPRPLPLTLKEATADGVPRVVEGTFTVEGVKASVTPGGGVGVGVGFGVGVGLGVGEGLTLPLTATPAVVLPLCKATLPETGPTGALGAMRTFTAPPLEGNVKEFP